MFRGQNLTFQTTSKPISLFYCRDTAGRGGRTRNFRSQVTHRRVVRIIRARANQGKAFAFGIPVAVRLALFGRCAAIVGQILAVQTGV